MRSIGKGFNMSATDPDNDAAKALPDAAKRALDEAAARRRAAENAPLAPEKNGPKGPEPTRYGDWERNGRAVDF
jgi:hypothetical protein